MNELFDYLDFVTQSACSGSIEQEQTLFTKVQLVNNQNKHKIRFSSTDVVLLGVNEMRNSSLVSTKSSPAAIRSCLYPLAAVNVQGSIYDIGDVKNTDSPEQTYAALEFVVATLLSMNVVVVIIGGSKDLTYPMVKGYSSTFESVNLCVVDSCISYTLNRVPPPSYTYINKVLDQNLIFDLSIVGFQSYLVNPRVVEELTKQHIELIRLGLIRENFCAAKPTFRNSNVVSFDIGAVRSSDCYGCCNPTPNGLYAEEVCQLSHYAGCSDKIACFGLFGYIPENDNKMQTAMLSAQVIWHFIEGLAHRQNETPDMNSANFQKYVVNMGGNESDLVFYKSELTGNWWVEVSKDPDSQVYIVPCSASDYALAGKMEVPERWYRFFCRLSCK